MTAVSACPYGHNEHDIGFTGRLLGRPTCPGCQTPGAGHVKWVVCPWDEVHPGWRRDIERTALTRT